MIVVFECQRVNTRVNSEGLTDCDALATAAYISAVSVDILGQVLFWLVDGQVLLDFVVEKVIIVVVLDLALLRLLSLLLLLVLFWYLLLR